MKLVENFFRYPATYVMGEVIGVAVNSKGHIFLLNRGYHPLIEFDAEGAFVLLMGEGSGEFEGAHTIRLGFPGKHVVHRRGIPNMVIKFDAEGRTEVLGMRPEPWTWATHVIEHAVPSKTAFYQPTDVTWAPDGSTFVSDGYGNSRVVTFDKEGNFIKSWGEHGTGKGDFNTPHSIVIDKNQNLYVADRGNSRIEILIPTETSKRCGPTCPARPGRSASRPGRTR